MFVTRVLDPEPVTSLAEYERTGGGEGLAAARKLGPTAVVEDLEASGLRGRGGAGFPTGRKWRTVAENRSATFPTTVVVNGAEGEPGSFKDRAILRANPYRVLEGALVAACTVGADRVVVGLKSTFEQERRRVSDAMGDLIDAGWAQDVELHVAAGPSEYLFGEETALLETLEGGHPLPRIAPPFRHGVDEIDEAGREVDTDTSAEVTMAASDGLSAAPPTLVNNVETLANVPLLLTEGPDWFRSVGTDASPGTVVCTISGQTHHHGVAEIAMGTPIAEALDEIGGGARDGHQLRMVLTGISNPAVPRTRFETPMSYEAMDEIGSGLGTAGLIAFDETADPVAIAHGISRFLAVESCGQCTPCKQDGLTIAEHLAALVASSGSERDLIAVDECLSTVADGARCFLARQHEAVVGSILELCLDDFRRHAARTAPATSSVLIAPIVDLVDGRAELDERQVTKNPDWTYGGTDSGKAPVDRLRGS